jgi:hypothetical protein
MFYTDYIPTGGLIVIRPTTSMPLSMSLVRVDTVTSFDDCHSSPLVACSGIFQNRKELK